MIVNIYKTIEGYDDGDFDVRSDYYKSDEEFFDAMQKEADKHSNLAYDVINNLGNNIQNKSAKFNMLNSKSNANFIKYKAEESKLLNENGNDETVDNLITNCVSQDVVIYTIKLNPDKIDAEFEEDYLDWIGEHKSINAYIDKLGEDKVWENEPTRTYEIEFLNNANETKYVSLENCKIIETDESNIYSCSVLAEKVTLIDRI